jgi:DNA-binding NarL/FixJ family response regulator
MLDALVEVFEAFWRLSAPILTTPGSDVKGDAPAASVEPTQETQHLLALLTAGLTDESIARMLGVSERTVSRRVGRLQELLGARTRFQLGVQASRRNWT